VDLPEDRSNSTSDRRDRNVDGTDNKSIVNIPQCISAAETTVVALPQ
jgi:hypothetical protein